MKVQSREIRRVESYEAIGWQGRTIPLVSLAGILDREEQPVTDATATAAAAILICLPTEGLVLC